MKKNKLKTFESLKDFSDKFFGLFKGTGLLTTLLKTDRKFAEKILLTVAMKNDCKG
jgi:hypothetical protein